MEKDKTNICEIEEEFQEFLDYVNSHKILFGSLYGSKLVFETCKELYDTIYNVSTKEEKEMCETRFKHTKRTLFFEENKG